MKTYLGGFPEKNPVFPKFGKNGQKRSKFVEKSTFFDFSQNRLQRFSWLSGYS